MASFVQATSGFNSSGSNANLFTSNFGAACTAGNALIIGVFMDSPTATVSTITDNATSHNTYTQLATFAGSWGVIYLYQAVNITGNAGAVYQIQVTESSPLDGQIFAQEWSGFPTAGSLLDVKRTDSGTSANPTTSGTLTTTQSNEVVFSLMMLQSQTNTWSAGSGYSNLSNVASSFTSAGMESATLAIAGGTTASFGMTNIGISYIQLTVALKTTASAAASSATAPPTVIPNRYVGPMALRRNFRQPVNITSQASTNNNYTQAVSGTLSFSGSQNRAISLNNSTLRAGLSFSASLAKQIAKKVSAALGFSGSITSGHLFAKALPASLSFAGSIAKITTKRVTATLSFAGTANLAKVVGKGVIASVSFTSSAAKLAGRRMSANVSFAGSMAIGTKHALTAAMSFAGALLSGSAHKSALSAGLSFSGSSSKTTSKLAAASLSYTGGFAKVTGHSLIAAVSFAGGISRSIRRSLGAALSLSGGFIGGSFHRLTLTAGLRFTGGFQKRAAKVFTASVSFAGTIGRLIRKTLSSGLSLLSNFLSGILRAFRPSTPITVVVPAPVTIELVVPAPISLTVTVNSPIAASLIVPAPISIQGLHD